MTNIITLIIELSSTGEKQCYTFMCGEKDLFEKYSSTLDSTPIRMLEGNLTKEKEITGMIFLGEKLYATMVYTRKRCFYDLDVGPHDYIKCSILLEGDINPLVYDIDIV